MLQEGRAVFGVEGYFDLEDEGGFGGGLEGCHVWEEEDEDDEMIK